MPRPRLRPLLLATGARHAAAYAPVSDVAAVIHSYHSDTGAAGSPAPPRLLTGGEASMNASTRSMRGWLSFRRIVDIPLETCVAALDSWQRTGQDSELHIGKSRLRGPIEHDHDSGTCGTEVRLARGPLRPLLRMRLDIDRWSASSIALELIPCGSVRPTAAYFRGGHLLLDSLTHSLRQHLPSAHARGTASQPRMASGSGRP